ncbi:helix-turn-helix domain-containing protein [Sinosporangium siamense]|uniref:AraC family transcriptional regulator n=1 Tax=Sinosporangium siamense TaxID=1367973 RepID=A0A919V9V4_9ACTN|nr:AraC family transcriptional regulator [Sinosporangium siamense]GII97605.1 AraC family transcriptional regulator [Sinosporangium siamense]
MTSLGRGVLHPERGAAVISVARHEPAAGLTRCVEFYWMVRWDRRGLPAYEQKVLSHPNIHLVFEAPRAHVYGVDRTLFVRRLEGAGYVWGVKFRPGWFRPFTGRAVIELADQALPAAEFFGDEADRLNDRVLAGPADPARLAALVDPFLLARLPGPDPSAETAAAMVEHITATPDLHRVDQVAEVFGVTVRTLQRLFADYVGASPKWVLRRARLHEAAERAARGDVDWAGLAADLGYADQAHFTRDFTAAVGVSPARYTVRV